MFSISFKKHGNKKENNFSTLVINGNANSLIAHAIITPTAYASSVFLSSCRNTTFNQSAHTHFLKTLFN